MTDENQNPPQNPPGNPTEAVKRMLRRIMERAKQHEQVRTVANHADAFSARLGTVLADDDVNTIEKAAGTVAALMRAAALIGASRGISPTRLIGTFVAETDEAYEEDARGRFDKVMQDIVGDITKVMMQDQPAAPESTAPEPQAAPTGGEYADTRPPDQVRFDDGAPEPQAAPQTTE